jgi:predicted nucleic acid-binding protein
VILTLGGLDVATDTVIATRCIVDGLRLLHNDRDFDAFEQHLGLLCVDHGA